MENDLIDMLPRRKAQLNNEINRALAIDLLDDVIKDLQTFESMELIQRAIEFLRDTKVEIKYNTPKS